MSPHTIPGAVKLASLAHAYQVRRYTGAPYFNHCAEVAYLVSCGGGDDDMVAAAYLHDTVEDTPVTVDDIRRQFGGDIAQLVCALTDVSKPCDGPRCVRKAIDREHSAKAPARAKSIKLADLISNSRCIVKNDPKFAPVYLREKRLLLGVLADASLPGLWSEADAMLTSCGY